ncbi:uncharacterized protein LOC131157575 [Malania oleifera]|uniref:uncharacterized protein LOC131157575 n=1 Tax=Malania oleifera TaxID=397392 RepID=UPI0025ADE8C6|nr:uncharacterized protein LOC131157575 [Malania oleifera]
MGRAAETESMLKRTLRTLCCSNGWSYGVLWRFDQRNSMLLTLEDAYYEEQMGVVVIDSMLLQVHMLGEGTIGQAAFTGKHQWIFSDVHGGDWNSLNSITSPDVCQGDSEFHQQFSSGIKTIAVISVESWGVVQFGSTQKILENLEFVDQAKRLFSQYHVDGIVLSDNAPSSLDSEIHNPSSSFDSPNSSGNSTRGHLEPRHNDDCKDPMGRSSSTMNFTRSSPFTSGFMTGSEDLLISQSLHPRNQFQMTATEAQVIFSKPSTQSQPVFLQSTASTNNLIVNAPCISAWSSEGSTLTSFERELPSVMGFQNNSNDLSARPKTSLSCGTTTILGDSTISSLYSMAGSIDVEKRNFYDSGKFIDTWNSTPSICGTEAQLPEASGSLCLFQEDISKPFLVDNILQWLTSSPDQSINAQTAKLNDELTQAIGVASVSSGLNGGCVKNEFLQSNEPDSAQSSISNTFNLDGGEKSLDVPCIENDLFDSLGLDFGSGLAGECWENMIMPAARGGHSAISSSISECVSEFDVGSMAGPRKGLFSELGLEQLLEGITSNANSVTKSSSDDQLSSTKRKRIENSVVNGNQVQLTGLSCIGGGMNVKQPLYNLDKNLASQKEAIPKSQVGLWIDDSYSINARSTVTSQSKKHEEPKKVTRKRVRPGESTRPRPKDRQLIQDRLKELKEIIPNGSKLSIDALLDHTAKHMLFLQSVTKYADRLKQTEEPKLIGQENGVVLRESFSGSGNSSGGATWAFEVGGQSMVCPIIVEDLNPPGQMLIEMLCEEGGFFLEIADVIRGFGLTILKGVMEVKENKIWARFTVEAKKENITRMDIFMSLVNLLQQTSTSANNSKNDLSNTIDGRVAPFNNYQQPQEPIPISLADACR